MRRAPVRNISLNMKRVQSIKSIEIKSKNSQDGQNIRKNRKKDVFFKKSNYDHVNQIPIESYVITEEQDDIQLTLRNQLKIGSKNRPDKLSYGSMKENQYLRHVTI